MFTRMRNRVVALLLLLVMAVMMGPKPAVAAEDDGGYCGDQYESTLSQEGQPVYTMHGPLPPQGGGGGGVWDYWVAGPIRAHAYYQDGTMNGHWWYFAPYHWGC